MATNTDTHNTDRYQRKTLSLEKVFEVAELSPFRNFSLKMKALHVKIF